MYGYVCVCACWRRWEVDNRKLCRISNKRKQPNTIYFQRPSGASPIKRLRARKSTYWGSHLKMCAVCVWVHAYVTGHKYVWISVGRLLMEFWQCDPQRVTDVGGTALLPRSNCGATALIIPCATLHVTFTLPRLFLRSLHWSTSPSSCVDSQIFLSPFHASCLQSYKFILGTLKVSTGIRYQSIYSNIASNPSSPPRINTILMILI